MYWKQKILFNYLNNCSKYKLTFLQGNFGGGNTKWEEKKLGKWSTSETRMLEVMENACGGGYGNIDLSSMDMHKAGKNADCYSMLG